MYVNGGSTRNRTLGRWLPSGGALPDSVWEARHRGIVWFLWAHVPVLLLVGIFTHHSALHSLLDMQPVLLAAAAASMTNFRRSVRAAVATFGLVACSAILVHFSGGVIEMHFHFFVVVGVVTLYQDWIPFVVAILFTVLEHGVIGVLAPNSVYNHHAAQADPWLWAGIHGGFVLAASVPHVLAWRQNEDQTFRDPLTRLSNRALLEERLSSSLARGTDTAVLFVDLDRFKIVNDTLGHGVGDEVLVACAGRLEHCIRAGDVVGRFGGDEFVVVMERANEAKAIALAERVLSALRSPVVAAGHELTVGASIGVAMSDANVRAAELLRNADLAMYVAKSTGRDRYEVYRPEMHARAIEHMRLEADLRQAVAAGDITIACQPIVRIEDGVTTGVEVLARWQHPERGPVPPAQFIAMAERIGLISEIGEQILRKACVLAGALADVDPSVTVSINLSPQQLVDEELPETVRMTLAEHGIDPQRIVLEITETILMHDVAAAARRISELKRLGVRIAVDDFGVGHSSLSYLRNLPVDVLKIDKSFVDDLPAGTEIARMMIDLGEMLGLDVVAEGVESHEQRVQLTKLGCRKVQGYLFARPMAPEVFLEQLAPRADSATAAKSAVQPI